MIFIRRSSYLQLRGVHDFMKRHREVSGHEFTNLCQNDFHEVMSTVYIAPEFSMIS